MGIRYRLEKMSVFQNENKRCKYQLSAGLVEKGIIFALTDMHNSYVNDKLKLGISYTLASKLNRRTYKAMTFPCESMDIHNDFVQYFIDQLVDRHWEAVIAHFNEHKPGQNYCQLMDMTVFKDMADNESSNKDEIISDMQVEVIEYKTPPVNVEVANNQGTIGKTFGCILTKAQKLALVKFVNACNLNFCKLTLQDIEDFFNCKEGFYIRPRRNTYAALILGALHEKGYIMNGKWADLTGKRRLLHSARNNKLLTAHNVSQSYSSTKKEKKKSNPVKQKILEFIEGLKDIK